MPHGDAGLSAWAEGRRFFARLALVMRCFSASAARKSRFPLREIWLNGAGPEIH
jgi:hypothetical protein